MSRLSSQPRHLLALTSTLCLCACGSDNSLRQT